MASGPLPRAAAWAAEKSPTLRRIPATRLLAAAEIALLARDHVRRITPHERRRIFELVRKAKGRARNLSEAERDELRVLVAKAEPRLFAGHAAEAFSPIPLPRRLLYGRRTG